MSTWHVDLIAWETEFDDGFIECITNGDKTLFPDTEGSLQSFADHINSVEDEERRLLRILKTVKSEVEYLKLQCESFDPDPLVIRDELHAILETLNEVLPEP